MVLNMEKRVYVCKSGLRLSYILYRTDPSDRSVLPAILYLHGADGRGDEIDTLLKIETLPSQILAGKHAFPENAVVIAPQCPAYENWSVIAEDVMDLMEHLIDTQGLDRSRISLTGCSLGGMGTFSLGIRYPDFFSCLVPVCASVDPASCSVLTRQPVRIFHGELDTGMGFSVVDADRVIRENGGQSELVMISDWGHEIRWIYYDPGFAVIPWMLRQRKRTGGNV